MIQYQQFTFLLLFSSLFVSSIDGFSISRASLTSFDTAKKNHQCSTCLRAEEAGADESEPQETEEVAVSSSGASDILSSPAFLKRKIDVLRSDITKAEEDLAEVEKAVEAGKAEWGPQLEELKKEYKNIQERLSSQSKQGNNMATVQVVREMLGVLDNFDRAFGQVTPETEAEESIEAEYRESYNMIFETFEKLGVKEVETVGKEFDFEYHQAVMQRPHEDFEEGIVCEEYQKGFVLGDTLIRAAMVAVAA